MHLWPEKRRQEPHPPSALMQRYISPYLIGLGSSRTPLLWLIVPFSRSYPQPLPKTTPTTPSTALTSASASVSISRLAPLLFKRLRKTFFASRSIFPALGCDTETQMSGRSWASLVHWSSVRGHVIRTWDLETDVEVENRKEVRSRWERRVRWLRGPMERWSSDDRRWDVLSSSKRSSPLRWVSFSLRLPLISGKRASNRAQILALNTAASQYRQIPQQRPETSRSRSGFDSREAIQFSSGTGMLWLPAPPADVPSFVGIDTATTDCRSGSVRTVIGIWNSRGGNGEGADKTRLCVCVKLEPGWVESSGSVETEIIVVFVVRDNGAKRVRYGMGSSGYSRANGFCEGATDGISGLTLERNRVDEKGRRNDKRDDIDGGGGSVVGGGAQDGFAVVRRALRRALAIRTKDWTKWSLIESTGSSHQVPSGLFTWVWIFTWSLRAPRFALKPRNVIL